MNAVEQIRAEIERLKNDASIGLSEYDAGYENGICDTCDSLLSFIDSLQPSETIGHLQSSCPQPSDDLKCKENGDSFTDIEKYSKVFEDKAKYFTIPDLEKASDEYAYTNWQSDDYHEGASEDIPFDPIGHTKKTFKAGANWQRQQYENGKVHYTSYKSGYFDGRSDEKKQMMKKAISGSVHHALNTHYIEIDQPQLNAILKEFDQDEKVKIIILHDNE